AGIDLKTGQNRWKIERARDINWVTPILRGDEVVFQAPEELVAYNIATGERRWNYATDKKLGGIPSPIVGAGGELIAPGGAELVALKPGAAGETPQVLWKSNKLNPGGFATPLYYNGHVFALNS